MDSKALYKLSYGLFLLTAKENGMDNGCIINTAIQVANDPTRISIACIKGNKTHDMIMNTREFNISTITEKAGFELFTRFGMQSGREVDKFDGFGNAERSENGLYYLTSACNMYMSAKVTQHFDLGSHTLFIGEVTDAMVLNDEASCTYAYYQSNIKPRPQQTKKRAWVCSICGYVHEADELPEDFICPLCKHGREYFNPA
ncbi:MAG: flavin reductase [Oscillospiraceae bacterium]|nr:flavin reductase [Oscillospiraceae bacterium]